MYDESTFPKIISVDDHIMEPPNVWQDRLPEKYKAVGPRVVRQKVADMQFVGGVFSYREAGEHEDGTWCDWWFVEDLRYPLTRVMAAAGYNAGPGRPAQWTAFCGDPRGGSSDPLDFIECIPFSETRNYVMRTMETTMVYRARLNGGVAPL